jgi:hypothetical protein
MKKYVRWDRTHYLAAQDGGGRRPPGIPRHEA